MVRKEIFSILTITVVFFGLFGCDLLSISEDIVSAESSVTRSNAYPLEESENGWFKSLSGSEIQGVEGGVFWSPVEKPTTIHRYFEPVPIEPGQTITIRMQWESDGRDGSNKELDGANSNPTDQGTGISDRYLRCIAGTGDFRIGFFESDRFVGNDTFEGNKRGATKDFNDYKGFQFRIHPHISQGFYDINRLLEDKDDGGRESHPNLSLWTRYKPGLFGLMSDEAQNDEDDKGGRSFTKSEPYGTQPVGWGPEMPFGEARELVVQITTITPERFEVIVTMNGNPTPLLSGEYKGDFRPEYFDTMAITYTNQSRRYEYVKITDFTVTHTGAEPEIPLPDPVQPELEGAYRLQNVLSGRYMDVKSASVENGANIQQYRQNGGDNQHWIFEELGQAYVIRSVLSGKVFDIKDRSTANYANLQQYKEHGGDNQLWELAPVGDAFVIVNLGSQKVLEVASGDLENGGNIIQNTYKGAENQLWKLESVEPKMEDPIPEPEEPSGLLAHYSFESVASDRTGNYRDADLRGGAEYSSRSVEGSYSVNLDGAGAYASLSDTLSDHRDFTFAAWVRYDGGNDWQRIFSIGRDRDNVMFLTPQDRDGYIRFRIELGGEKQSIKTQSIFPRGEWVHVALSLRGDHAGVYLNGEQIASSDLVSFNPEDLEATELWLGRSMFDDPSLNGRLDSVRFYSRGLLQDEVMFLYHQRM